jgi:uncharacterized protein (UPF0335 family)
MDSVLLLDSESEPRSATLVMDELSQLPVRVARLESDVEYIKKDVADIKVDIRRMDDRMRGFEERVNARFDGVDAKFDSLDQRLNAKIDGNRLLAEDAFNRLGKNLGDRIDALQQDLSSAKIWALGLYIGQAATLLLVMAKGFKWI